MQGFVPEASMPDPSLAIGSGYPESKWVAERVLTLAAEKTGIFPVIVRIGQLSGGSNGSWNPSEWVPSIVRSGQVLGCLPRAPGVNAIIRKLINHITDFLVSGCVLDTCFHRGRLPCGNASECKAGSPPSASKSSSMVCGV